jgi:hypothetical protein
VESIALDSVYNVAGGAEGDNRIARAAKVELADGSREAVQW